MSDQFRSALARLDEVIQTIGSSQDRFAQRRQQGDLVLFETPGSYPGTAAASAEMWPERDSLPAAPAPAKPVEG